MVTFPIGNKEAAGVSGGGARMNAYTFYRTAGAWQRVSKSRPCPICGKGDWCRMSADGEFAVCMRIEGGAVKRTRNDGYLHRLANRPAGRHPGFISSLGSGKPSRHDLSELAKRNQTAVKPGRLESFAGRLGITVPSLRALGVGWDTELCAWSFPMSDADGTIIGIRLRCDYSGKKFAVTGGKEGLFLPVGLAALGGFGGDLFITEGPTDCASLVDLGFAAVGRPSCTGGTKLLAALVKKAAPSRVVIVADADPPGRRGAGDLALLLRLYCRDVCTITPPDGVKDARAWKRSGATAADVKTAVDEAARIILHVKRTNARSSHD